MGTAEDILLRPADDYVAEFVKHMNPLNVLRGTSVMTPASALRREGGAVVIDAGAIRVRIDAEERPGRRRRSTAARGASPPPTARPAAITESTYDMIVAPVDLTLRAAIALKSQTDHPDPARRSARPPRRPLRRRGDLPRPAAPRRSRNENPRSRGRDRRRRGRRLDALSSRQEGLVRRRAGRAQGADLRLDLARRRPAAALQHELLGRPDPQILGRPLQDAGGRDRPECRLPASLQHPPRPHQGPLGRVHVLRRRRPHDRRQRQHPDARRR